MEQLPYQALCAASREYARRLAAHLRDKNVAPPYAAQIKHGGAE